MTGNTDMHLLVPLNKKVGAWNRKSVIIWCDHHLPHAARHFLLIELIDSGLWNVVPSSSMAVWSCWILAETGTFCRSRRPRASQTCSMGDISGEYASHVRTGHFQVLGIVYRSLRHVAVHYHAETWGDGGGWMAWQWASGSRHGISAQSNCHR
jgi:hypothetical protein